MITGNRNEYIGAHVTKPVKEALFSEALRQEISRSKLIFDALVEYLRKRGYDGLLD